MAKKQLTDLLSQNTASDAADFARADGMSQNNSSSIHCFLHVHFYSKIDTTFTLSDQYAWLATKWPYAWVPKRKIDQQGKLQENNILSIWDLFNSDSWAICIVYHLLKQDDWLICCVHHQLPHQKNVLTVEVSFCYNSEYYFRLFHVYFCYRGNAMYKVLCGVFCLLLVSSDNTRSKTKQNQHKNNVTIKLMFWSFFLQDTTQRNFKHAHTRIYVWHVDSS